MGRGSTWRSCRRHQSRVPLHDRDSGGDPRDLRHVSRPPHPVLQLGPAILTNSTKANFSPLLEAYKEMGCKGVGEYVPNLNFDDPLNMNFFGQVEEAGLPLTFHIAPQLGGYYGCVDEVGLPRLEIVLKSFPKLIFLAHSQPFWAEISTDVIQDGKRCRLSEGQSDAGPRRGTDAEVSKSARRSLGRKRIQRHQPRPGVRVQVHGGVSGSALLGNRHRQCPAEAADRRLLPQASGGKAHLPGGIREDHLAKCEQAAEAGHWLVTPPPAKKPAYLKTFVERITFPKSWGL